MEIFVCPTGSISVRSERALREAGVVVVQAADPEKCRFIRAGEEIGSHDLLWAALKAMQISSLGYSDMQGVAKVQQEMTKVIFGIVNDRRELAQAIDAVARVPPVSTD